MELLNYFRNKKLNSCGSTIYKRDLIGEKSPIFNKKKHHLGPRTFIYG